MVFPFRSEKSTYSTQLMRWKEIFFRKNLNKIKEIERQDKRKFDIPFKLNANDILQIKRFKSISSWIKCPIQLSVRWITNSLKAFKFVENSNTVTQMYKQSQRESNRDIERENDKSRERHSIDLQNNHKTLNIYRCFCALLYFGLLFRFHYLSLRVFCFGFFFYFIFCSDFFLLSFIHSMVIRIVNEIILCVCVPLVWALKKYDYEQIIEKNVCNVNEKVYEGFRWKIVATS